MRNMAIFLRKYLVAILMFIFACSITSGWFLVSTGNLWGILLILIGFASFIIPMLCCKEKN